MYTIKIVKSKPKIKIFNLIKTFQILLENKNFVKHNAEKYEKYDYKIFKTAKFTNNKQTTSIEYRTFRVQIIFAIPINPVLRSMQTQVFNNFLNALILYKLGDQYYYTYDFQSIIKEIVFYNYSGIENLIHSRSCVDKFN